MPFRPELVIFDLDGTLIEFPHDYLFEETHRILNELSRPLVHMSILKTCFSSFDYFQFIPEPERLGFMEYFWESFNHRNYPEPVPLPGSYELLESLADRGIKIAIATARTASQNELLEQLAYTGFAEYISMIAPRDKQDADWMNKQSQIRHICDSLNVIPEQSAMVGDIPPDITSAKHAGIGFSIAVRSGGIDDVILKAAEPDLLLDSIADIRLNEREFIE